MATSKKAPAKTTPAAKSRSKKPEAPPLQYGLRSDIVKLPELDLSPFVEEFARVDMIFSGIDHSGPSFEVRVFLDNANADQETAMNTEEGYVGRFHIFGHGGCFGDAGHCQIRGKPRLYDPRPAHPLTPARKTLIATEEIRTMAKRKKSASVTLVPIVTSLTDKCDVANALKLDSVSLFGYS